MSRAKSAKYDDSDDDDGDDDAYDSGSEGYGTRVTNVMASVDLGVRLDLKYLCSALWNVEYQPTKNAALVLNLKKPVRATISVYASGKMTSIGTRSERACADAMRRVAKQIRRVGYDAARDKPEVLADKRERHAHSAGAVLFRDFTVTNMVGAASFGHKLRLEAFAHDYERCCSYEPEVSAAAEFVMTDPAPCNFRVFVSGKILIPRVRSHKDLHACVEELFKLLTPYKL